LSPRAVVIGSGVGGLTSAILLAQRGWQVTVCERHTRPGGFLHRFFREGIPYDTGFHYCGGTGEDQIFGRILRHLGVFDDLRFRPLDPDGFDHLEFPDFRFRVPAGAARYREHLLETFPYERDGLQAFFDACADAIANQGLYSFSFDVDPARFVHWETTTVTQALSGVRDPRARAVIGGQGLLYGVPPDEAPLSLHAVTIDHFLQGPARIDGGGDRLAKVMVQRLKSLGGTLRLKAEVGAIDVDDAGDARAVTLASGERLGADLVVANVHPRLLAELLPEHAVRKAWRSRVATTRVSRAHLGLYLQLDAPPADVGNHNVYAHASLDMNHNMRPVTEAGCGFWFATAPATGEDRRSDQDALLVLTELDWASVAPWVDSDPGYRPTAYLAFKERMTDVTLQAVLSRYPDLRIRRVEASTPLSTWRWTRSPEGAMYGHYHSVSQMGRARPSPVTRVGGLVLCGHGVFAPGVLGASLSAYYALSQLIGRERLVDELRGLRAPDEGPTEGASR
jgi:all-trans-retinol 13,14-reductase